MKLTSPNVLGTLFAAAGLAGCGTLPSSGSAGGDDIDQAKVNAINNAARAQGVQVHWINFPQRLKTSGAIRPGGAG